MVKGQVRCVNLLTMAEFEAVASRLREASMTNKSTRDYVRVLFAAAYDQVPDKQGRVSRPGAPARVRLARPRRRGQRRPWTGSRSGRPTPGAATRPSRSRSSPS